MGKTGKVLDSAYLNDLCPGCHHELRYHAAIYNANDLGMPVCVGAAKMVAEPYEACTCDRTIPMVLLSVYQGTNRPVEEDNKIDLLAQIHEPASSGQPEEDQVRRLRSEIANLKSRVTHLEDQMKVIDKEVARVSAFTRPIGGTAATNYNPSSFNCF